VPGPEQRGSLRSGWTRKPWPPRTDRGDRREVRHPEDAAAFRVVGEERVTVDRPGGDPEPRPRAEVDLLQHGGAPPPGVRRAPEEPLPGLRADRELRCVEIGHRGREGVRAHTARFQEQTDRPRQEPGRAQHRRSRTDHRCFESSCRRSRCGRRRTGRASQCLVATAAARSAVVSACALTNGDATRAAERNESHPVRCEDAFGDREVVRRADCRISPGRACVLSPARSSKNSRIFICSRARCLSSAPSSADAKASSSWSAAASSTRPRNWPSSVQYPIHRPWVVDRIVGDQARLTDDERAPHLVPARFDDECPDASGEGDVHLRTPTARAVDGDASRPRARQPAQRGEGVMPVSAVEQVGPAQAPDRALVEHASGGDVQGQREVSRREDGTGRTSMRSGPSTNWRVEHEREA
jgi:hypothetical protein